MQKMLLTIIMTALCSLFLGTIILTDSAVSEEMGPLAKIIDNVRQTGTDNSGLSVKLCKPFALDGLTDDGKNCPTKKKVIDQGDQQHIIDVGINTSGQTTVVIWYRTKTEGTFFLTSAQGDLEKAFYAGKCSLSDLPLSPAVRSD